MHSPEQVRSAFEQTRERIERAGGVDVALVAVTKGFGPEAVSMAASHGADAIGESYVQELLPKLDAVASEASVPPLFFIGQLQTNKVRAVAGRVARYESVDRSSLIAEIARRDPGAEVLIQVVPESWPGKGGCPLAAVDDMVARASDAGLRVAGLMTVGPTEGGPEAARPGFAAVRAAVDRLGLEVCSMGMSNDLEVAIQEGSTEVRLGSALFGQRRYRAR